MPFNKGLNEAKYSDIRNDIQPGDVLAFGGTAFGSRWIQLCSKSNVNHVATVLRRHKAQNAHEYDLEIIESVYHRDGITGVRTIIASELINSYPGKVWWLPLHKDHQKKIQANLDLFTQCLLRQKGKDFDFKSATRAVFDGFDKSGLTYAHEDFSRFFCAELVAFGLEQVGILRNVNASEVTPIDLCRFNLYNDHYVLIHDHKDAHEINKTIKGFNTIDGTGWGM